MNDDSGGSQGAREPKTSRMSDMQQYDLERVANKNILIVICVSLLVTPLGYWMVGRKMLALVNFLTLNFALLGFVIVPIHTYLIIKGARKKLRRAGVGGY